MTKIYQPDLVEVGVWVSGDLRSAAERRIKTDLHAVSIIDRLLQEAESPGKGVGKWSVHLSLNPDRWAVVGDDVLAAINGALPDVDRIDLLKQAKARLLARVDAYSSQEAAE